MTSQVSLTAGRQTRARSPWAHSFWQAVRENAVLTVVNTVLFIFVMAVLNMISLNGQNGTGQPNYHFLKYSLFAGDLLYYLLPVLLLESALVQGILTFRFLFSRKASNAWYSIGISRNDLFWSRFTAGAVGVILPVFLAMMATLAINFAYFSDVGLILARFTYFLLGISLQAFVLYGLTVIVCTATTTIGEGIGHSIVLICLPTILFVCFSGLMTKFLFGNPYGISDQSYYSFNSSLVGALPNWNPLILMCPYIQRFSSAPIQQEAAYLNGLPPLSINWTMLLMWAVASLAFLWIAHRAFMRRKVETTGILGAGKTVASISLFAVSFFAFCIVFILPQTITRGMPTGIMLVIAVASAVIAMLAMSIPLKMVPRPIWKGLLTLTGGLAAMLAVVGVLAAGGLGFSSYVPDSVDVKSATISYGGLPLYFPKSSGSSRTGLIGELTSDCSVTLTEQPDIDLLVGIHRDLIKSGPKTASARGYSGPNKVNNIRVLINYTLADGRTVTRSYLGLDAAMMKKMVLLDNAVGVKKAYSDSLSIQNPSAHPEFAFANGTIYLCAPYYSKIAPINLDEAKRAELLQCIAQDLTTQSVDDRYFPEDPEICTLVFSSDVNMDAGITDDFGMVYVTDQFKRTLAFLQNNDLMASLAQKKKIEYLGIVDIGKVEYSFDDYLPRSSFPVFYNGISGQGGIDDFKRWFDLNLYITDSNQQQQILSHCHDMYLVCDGGYVVLIKYKGENMVTSAFLPMKDAPDFIKNALK